MDTPLELAFFPPRYYHFLRQRYPTISWGAQILYLGVGLFIIAAIFTVAARHHPKGAQPATYGDIRTLLRLVDDWQQVMYWGHKDDGPPCHAGATFFL